jgi:hypothetical protein
MPRIHPREQVVGTAGREISEAVARIAFEHDLTYAEIFSILGGEIQGQAKYAIRAERHPDDPDAPGGLE